MEPEPLIVIVAAVVLFVAGFIYHFRSKNDDRL